ncbi:MAG: class I SAM-dependent methyltransferase [Bacteroidetes bacterium]|nr:class I SAM-dependent methyltransferase [Bacteroidota bacterium]
MNLSILNTEVQDFINSNLNTDTSILAFKGSPFKHVTTQELIHQLVSKIKCKEKLPSWFNTPFIYYPPKVNIEQSSSEITANYKANLISGDTIIDITGGFGVDSYYFSKYFKEVTHCEINEELSAITAYNYKRLKKDINCIADDGIEFLKTSSQFYDWIYLDPSRRNDVKGKVFKLSDCLPNVPVLLDALFLKSNNILIKVSPLLDITAAINELKFVTDVHIVAVDNEVKELIIILKNRFINEIKIHTVNITKEENQVFSFTLNEHADDIHFSSPLTYLYEPNKALYKSGCFNLIATKFNIFKLSSNTHLYTSNELITFPGSSYEVLNSIPYNFKKLKEILPELKGNIKIRNFKDDIKTIKKKMKLTDGGNYYLFFGTDFNEKPFILITKKVKYL